MTEKKRLQNKINDKARRDRLRAAGKCYTCKKPSIKFTRCWDCRQKFNKIWMEKYYEGHELSRSIKRRISKESRT